MRCKTILSILCLSAFAGAAVAGVDANNDARVGLAEAAIDTRVSAAFERADRDGDGKLTRGEFEAMAKDARAYGLPRARQAERVPLGDRDRIFQALDWDEDGKVSKVEAAADKRVLEDFERADADDNGFLSRPELNRVLALGHR